jgi:ABC-type phosphate/phosphonate transport system permease subunit
VKTKVHPTTYYTNTQRGTQMPRKEILIFTSLIVAGFLDWLTTMVGIAFFGASELNPLMAGLTQTNLVAFSALKLAAIVVVALLFFKASNMTTKQNLEMAFTRKFLNIGYFTTFFGLTAVFLNNAVAML